MSRSTPGRPPGVPRSSSLTKSMGSSGGAPLSTCHHRGGPPGQSATTAVSVYKGCIMELATRLRRARGQLPFRGRHHGGHILRVCTRTARHRREREAGPRTGKNDVLPCAQAGFGAFCGNPTGARHRRDGSCSQEMAIAADSMRLATQRAQRGQRRLHRRRRGAERARGSWRRRTTRPSSCTETGRAAAGHRRVRQDYQVGRDGDEKVDLVDGRAAVLSAHAFRAATPEKNNRRSGGR